MESRGNQLGDAALSKLFVDFPDFYKANKEPLSRDYHDSLIPRPQNDLVFDWLSNGKTNINIKTWHALLQKACTAYIVWVSVQPPYPRM